MLVLTRRENESFQIDDDITIKILEIRGNRIRLGIIAPVSRVVKRFESLPKEIEIEIPKE